MAIKVQFSTGESTATVKGLYQWDYGQVLEIECAEIGSEILEVHFACPNMSEAIVRTCAFTNGIGTVTIPDECLEQTSAVTAWVYKVDSTQGHTIKTISLPITARTRPSNSRDVPADYTDKYGQLIEEVNEAVDAIEKGNVTAANALSANTAGHATTAGSATSATYATSAGSANSALTVGKYLHNVRLDFNFSDYNGTYKGSLFFQIINNMSSAISMANIANQTTQFSTDTPLPCSGILITSTVTSGTKMYSVAAMGLTVSHIFPFAFDDTGSYALAIGGLPYANFTVEYDAVIQI